MNPTTSSPFLQPTLAWGRGARRPVTGLLVVGLHGLAVLALAAVTLAHAPALLPALQVSLVDVAPTAEPLRAAALPAPAAALPALPVVPVPEVVVTPPPAPVDQAAPAKAVDAAAASTKADAAAPAADLQPRSRDGSRDLATPVKVETPPEVARKPRPRRTGPPIPPVRGPLDWNPNLNFQAPPPPVVAPPVAAAPKEPVQAESKPKRPKRTGPPIPPLRP